MNGMCRSRHMNGMCRSRHMNGMCRKWRMKTSAVLAATVLALLTAVPIARAQVTELQGSWIIDGYRFDPGDRSPRGTIAYDRDANAFNGTYVGLKLPAERPELHAWLYDTRSKRAEHLGKVPYQAG